MLGGTEIRKLQKRLVLSAEDTLVAETFAILGDKTRFRIMKMLLATGELCVSDIASVLGISVSAASQHLRVLEMSDLVVGERMGQMMCYSPRTDHPDIQRIISFIT